MDDINLYRAVREATIHVMKNGVEPPTMMLHANCFLHRVVDIEPHYKIDDMVVKKDSLVLQQSKADEALRARDYGRDSNRFSGQSPDSEYNNGGVYFFTHEGSGLAEMMHYAQTDVPKDHRTNLVSINQLMARK